MGSGDGFGARARRLGPGEALALALVLAAGIALPAALGGGERGLAAPLAPEPAYAAADAPCGGAPLPDPDRVITGSFGPARQGDYVMLPFDVPAGTDAIRVKYCHDQPALAQVPGTDRLNKHTIDMGVYGARSAPGELWGEEEFRGWGGSSRPDVTISPEGSFDPDPAPVATTETTIGYRPGPVEPGEWAVELGVAAVGTELATEDGAVAWRVEIDLIDDPSFADEPYEPAPYDETPANPKAGWYAGDFHVHARHSAPGDATMAETFEFAFAPMPEGAGLDFITLSDYVSDRAWGEIGAFQPQHPGKLIVRSAEVITYRGHVNNHAGEFVDYRTGRVLERSEDGSLALLRKARPAREILADIHASGGWNQLNHVETFPSEVPTFGNLCRGCSWEYSDEETDYSRVDSIEVATGPAGAQGVPTEPGPNPFTLLALEFYEDAIDSGGRNANHIAAVASSDSHNAGSPDDPLLQSPIGQATTVVRAEELSEQGVGEAIRAGHSYVKLWGNDGPDLRFEASAPEEGAEPAIMGDTIAAEAPEFTARVLSLDRARAARDGLYTLLVIRDGLPLAIVPIPPGDEFSFEFPGLGGPARYRIQVQRLVAGVASIEATTTPIWVEAPASGGPEEGEGAGPGGEGGGPGGASGPPRCAAALVGTKRADKLVGTPASELIRGRRGADRIRGRGGDDCLRGGRGRDRISGGTGDDRIRAGRGDDRVRAADGERDVVRCGRGEDRVRADRFDVLRGCELARPKRRG